MAGLSSPGIGSGLDINGLVTKLMSVEQQPLTKLDTDEAKYQAKLSALGTLKGSVSSLQTSVAGLNSASRFSAKTASVGDSSIFSASATSLAATGTYSMAVSSLAQAQTLSSTGYASTDSVVGSGSLTIQFGTSGGSGGGFTLNPNKGTQTITISSGQNSLGSIKEAINAAKAGVTASIIDDGSTNGKHLVLTSDSGGSANAMSISTTGTLSALAYDPTAASSAMAQTLAAQDAVFTLNGQTITKSSNTVTDAIHGVTLNLSKVGTSATTLSISQDTAGTTSAVQSFITAYNAASKALSDASAYDAKSKTAAPLQGNASVLMMQRQMRSMLGKALSNPSGGLSTLSDIGVSFQRDGTLSLDSAKLAKVLADPTKDVSTLFAAVGKATDSLTTVTSSSTKTQPGSYALNVTQIATRGTGTSATMLSPSSTITASVDDSLSATIDGTVISATLRAGTYNQTQLAAEIQSEINGSSAIVANGSSVTVGYSGTQGSVAGSAAANLVISALNNTIDGISVDGVQSGTITLTAGTYTAATLAAEVQKQINADTTLAAANVSVLVSQSNGTLTLTSTSYGDNATTNNPTSSVSLAAASGNGLANLLGAAPVETLGTGSSTLFITSNRFGSTSSVNFSNTVTGTSVNTAGVDVAGTIGGAAATGSGQTLTGSGNTADLKLLIDGGAVGDRGTVNFSQGFAFQLNVLTSAFLDDTNGVIFNSTDGVNKSIADITKQRTALQSRLVDIEARYRKQFNALDSLIASMQSTQTFLTGQFAQMSALTNSTK